MDASEILYEKLNYYNPGKCNQRDPKMSLQILLTIAQILMTFDLFFGSLKQAPNDRLYW